MYKLNQVLTTSKKLICYKVWRKITNFFKKITNIPPPLPHSAAINSEFTIVWRGEEVGYL
jgi:hypothetical protein